MSISAPFIHRPVGTTLLTIALALAGSLAYFFLPVSPLPQVDNPTISVSAGLPGASPETMASSVATPLERQFGRIAGVTEMTSSSSLGSTNITLQFDLSRNIDAAARDVQAAIAAAAGNLPANLPSKPTYRKVNPADAPILIYSMTSDIYDKPRMYDAASTILQQKLSQVEGVGQVSVSGGALPAVRVDVNPTILNNMGLSLEDVRATLAAANANRPKGQISDERRSWSISATDQILKAKEYEPLVVANRNGAIVRLSDVATVTDSVENVLNGGWSDGKPAVSLILFRQPGANIIETVDRLRAMTEELQASIPPGMKLAVVMDRATTIRASVHDVQVTLLISIVLVILVVFMFLRDWRTTLIPSVAVPISLVGTFAVMYLLNFSIDNLSLMALTIATGFVVDDAIVVIENITRYIEEGMSPMQAALRGAKEIGFTVVSMSVSLIAVFIPILLMSGLVGRLFREFAITLSVAVAISLVISLTTTPMMCATLLRGRDEQRHGRIYMAGEKAFNFLLWLYEFSLAWVLRYWPVGLLVTVLSVVATVLLFLNTPTDLFPVQDSGRMSVRVLADQDTSAQTMQRLMVQYANVIRNDPGVANVVGFSSGGSNQGSMFVALKPLSERAGMDAIMTRLRGQLGRIPGAQVTAVPVQDIRVGGRIGGGLYQYTLQGDDLGDLMTWAPKVAEKMRGIPGIVDVTSDQQNKGLQADLTYDRVTAARLGLSAKVIDDTLYDAFGQRQVSTMFTPLNQYHVVMEVSPQYTQNPDGLNAIYVRASNGTPLPLSSIAQYEANNTSLSVAHQGQYPAVTISFNLADGMSLGAAVDKIKEAEAQMGLPASIHGSFPGTAQAFEQSRASMPILILAALVAVYIVLGMLYESLIHPITILSTLPSAGVGALLALHFTNTHLSMIAFIGIILLIGIVKKNGIMMVDFALEAERSKGLRPEEAVFQACILRFRPIMMTTMAALLGGLPLALGTGTGSELRKPLGIAIVGGLIVSQALTLYTTPVVYLCMDYIRLFLRRLFHPNRTVVEVMPRL